MLTTYERHHLTGLAMSESELPEGEGDLRVWWIPQVPGKAFRRRVDDLAQAAVLLDALAAYDAFQLVENIKGDYANAGGLEVYRGGDWEEWCVRRGIGR